MSDPRAAAALAPVLVGCGPAATPAPPERIGFKAHNLARMAALGLPVPPAFVLPTGWCADAAALRPAHWQGALQALEAASGARLGDARRPLLVSVRSGAPVSMPGMMETLLNVGLADATVPGLLRATGNPRLVWDAYRRLVAGFGEVVLGVAAGVFEADLAQVAAGRDERELDFAELRTLTRLHLAAVRRESGSDFPQHAPEQLAQAVHAVFASWQSDKACAYRRLHALPEAPGTAVTVQRMVFGNGGGLSGAGVGFTRHPSTGAPEPWVDFLFNAQGEDVVSGRRSARGHDELAAVAPALWRELLAAARTLERAFGDMQDLEFTVEDGRLWLLQARAGKRSAEARARIALDLLDEGVIDAAEARRRTEGLDAAALATTRVVESDGRAARPLAQAVSAAHGVAAGEIALDEERARARRAAGAPVLLLRRDAETRDLAALELAAGLLTARGARTSHAAVVARPMGKVCLVGCETLEIDEARRRVRFGAVELAEGDTLTLDGHAGCVWRGAVKTVREEPRALLDRLAALRHRTAPASR
ncbi:MAG: PEP/pyruvate-binding domain-containing protein [Rubrivivax sp.]